MVEQFQWLAILYTNIFEKNNIKLFQIMWHVKIQQNVLIIMAIFIS